MQLLDMPDRLPNYQWPPRPPGSLNSAGTLRKIVFYFIGTPAVQVFTIELFKYCTVFMTLNDQIDIFKKCFYS